MIVDTSALLAYFDRQETQHDAVTRVLETTTDELVISPYIIAELDYLILTRHGISAERTVLRELSGGAWTLASMTLGLLVNAVDILERYVDQKIGIADASNLVLAQKYGTRTILTLDRRHFSVLRFEDGTAPVLLPH